MGFFVIKFYSVRNQFGISYHLKLLKWKFTVFTSKNNINNAYLKSIRSIGSRQALELAIKTISKRYEVTANVGELVIRMRFAKDAQRTLDVFRQAGTKWEFIEVSWFESLFLKNTWKDLMRDN